MPSVQGDSMKIIHHFQRHGAGDISDSLSKGELHSELSETELVFSSSLGYFH